jgi:hypothetical protein
MVGSSWKLSLSDKQSLKADGHFPSVGVVSVLATDDDQLDSVRQGLAFMPNVLETFFDADGISHKCHAGNIDYQIRSSFPKLRHSLKADSNFAANILTRLGRAD